MKQIYDTLQLIPVDKIDLHEAFEPSRLEKTKKSIAKEQHLRHPVLVVKTLFGRYMVIDGVHRFMSLKALGCEVIPVQVIQRTQYSIGSWHHKIPNGAWCEGLTDEELLPWTTEVRDETPFITMCDQQTEHYLYVADLTVDKLDIWKKVVNSYSASCNVERVPHSACLCLDSNDILMKYQPLQIGEIEAVVQRGQTVPAGVTRFNIAGRCLNLQVPLHLLKNSNLGNQEQWHTFLQKKIESMRCYTEKIYLIEAE
ncbi:bifunctional transcriptional regulator/O-phospho-L-serine synthase SbnI [Staphylococcus pseudintermedius]|uniref:bifunctional transcriptional regulator/O-phospho-L-serine synthase SbnI n=1 Tax=Staphylococcus pseudintermedius TaxID=283734 RepID=UPI0028840938|nr:bifunctional transcriptional regulator/O-phospho-L-serine synthase SbnI [Staphylococcus pseudintermedius]MDT0783819.1 bifunctional transcriptional regulator/O-phospho-L-serine synthase SbnI [Staphylococcus pseudintermedius]MDT0815640.1 bifunctional transcriptional regulator/O-phospho-L-serine synthase SbnI [Staphylococcus pseudintermedius]MDT0883132.1 bifunctional transcriptional regulator/O-phospho-L-serine synthase SbnI [Staphylococcus pseudintermedius]MDT0919334.1 bifunctional transcripti